MGKIKFSIYNTPENKENASMPYARKVSRGTKHMDDICEVLTESCSVTSSDIKGVLEALVNYMGREMAEGYDVKLEGIGVFSPALKSTQKVNEKGQQVQSFMVDGVNFRCSLRLKRTLQRSVLEKVKRHNLPTMDREGRKQKVVDYLQKHQAISVSDYAILNQCSRYAATNDLKQFLSDGIVSTLGHKTHRVYLLAGQEEPKPVQA